MRKTKKMKNIEKRIGMDLGKYLQKSYVESNMSTVDIGKELGIRNNTVGCWMDKYDISRRNLSESQLAGRGSRPSKLELDRMYNTEGKTLVEIGEIQGVCADTIGHWIGDYKIEDNRAPEKHVLEEMYNSQGMSINKIGLELGVSRHIAGKWLDNYNISKRESAQRNIPIPNKKTLDEMYNVQNLSLLEIGRQSNVSSHTVKRWLKIKGIETRSPSEVSCLSMEVTKPSKKMFKEMYYEQKLSLSAISKELKISYHSVNYWFNKFEFKQRTLSETVLLSSGGRKPSKKELINMYEKKGMSTVEIGEKMNVSHNLIARCLDEHNIRKRTSAESQLLLKGIVKPSKEELDRMYNTQGMFPREISRKIGVSNSTVSNWIKEFDLQKNKRSEKDQIESLLEKYAEGGE